MNNSISDSISEVNEAMLQHGIAEHLQKLGWTFTANETPKRRMDEVFRFEDLEPALIRLNPEVADDPTRAEQIMTKLRAVLLSVGNDGLVAANEEFVQWLCGRRSIRYIGMNQDSQVRLIDFDNPRSNNLRVTTETTFHAGREHRRFDLVLWVNGLPLVVGETKTPAKANLSWLNGATDIHNGYEVKVPGFFVPNVLSFATEGREFHYGAVRQSPETWLNWGSTTDETMEPSLTNVMRSVELLLSPEMVLEILRTFTLYSSRRTTAGAIHQKVIPRYPQVEAVEAIVERCINPIKHQGLVWHHQGSGKTFAMAFAAGKLRQQLKMDAPTIVIVLDRLELIQQTQAEFSSVGISGLKVAETIEDLRRLLRDDARGVIITTIYRFKGADKLNDRSNIVVMVDEAHRTQEGQLGQDMREALPNAKFIGLTGTPISTNDHNTWAMFGDPDDPDGALNRYSVERSIHDGATLPVHVETRLVNFHFNAVAVQEAFDELAEEEKLDEGERDVLARKASHISVVVKGSDRIEAVCADIVEHYRTKIAPLGLKAQVVAYDRATCVAYHETISALLGPGEEATVVMTTVKDDPPEWEEWNLERDAEAVIKDRFRDVDDPLKFLIVTAKLLTGFDAPIEGVMYLDRPLRAHTLFQAVCRTNRRWTNPRTGQEKLHGLIVDYIGIGPDLAKAVAVKPVMPDQPAEGALEVLLAELVDNVTKAIERFSGVDRSKSMFDQIFYIQQILDTQVKRNGFAAEFMRCQGLFEFLWPDTALRPIEDDYKFLAMVYASITPNNAADLLLWHRLGAKTSAIVHEHLQGVTIDASQLETIAMDAEIVEVLKELKLIDDPPEPSKPAPTAWEVLERLEDRIRRRMEGDDPHRVWKTLAERLEQLRLRRAANAEESVEFLKELLVLARKLLIAEAADDDGRLDEVVVDPPIVVVDPRKGALTQIFDEYKPADCPVVIETVVDRVDALVQPVRGTNWQTSHPGDRQVRRELSRLLKKCGLPPKGSLYDHAYAYICENY